MEKRANCRFGVRLSCRIRRDNSPEVVDGTTIDIGRSGALISLENSVYPGWLPQPGNALILEILLPVNRTFGPRCVLCEGMAVRTSYQAERRVLAVSFEQVEFGKVPLSICSVRAMVV